MGLGLSVVRRVAWAAETDVGAAAGHGPADRQGSEKRSPRTIAGAHEVEVALPDTGASTSTRIEPGIDARLPSKPAVEVYFLRGGLLSRLPPEGFPGFFDGLPPLLLFEPPERLPPLFVLFLDIVWESFFERPRSSGHRGGSLVGAAALKKVGRVIVGGSSLRVSLVSDGRTRRQGRREGNSRSVRLVLSRGPVPSGRAAERFSPCTGP